MNIRKLAELLGELDDWRQQEKAAKEMASKLSVQAVKAMQELKAAEDKTTLTFDKHGQRRRATLVEPTKTILDEEGLLADLTPAQRKLITRTVVDRTALSDAIDRGTIPGGVVDPHVTTEDGTPSIRISGQ